MRRFVTCAQSNWLQECSARGRVRQGAAIRLSGGFMFRRLLCAIGLLVAPVFAGPPLTTIQDVIYKADGTRFNGTITIRWTSFEGIDHSNIATQQTQVRVVDGNLRVQLVPSTTATPPVFYSVSYNSDGR